MPCTAHSAHPVHLAYAGLRVSLLTQHGKQHVLRSVLESGLGCQLVHTDGFDTDLLGTFTQDVARAGSQLEACRRKARIGMALTDAAVGIASEGAFGPDPFAGLMPWNTEMVLWVDSRQGTEVTGLAQGPAQSMQKTVMTADELMRFADEALFPEHHLVLRPDHPEHPEIFKGLADAPSLLAAFHAAQAISPQGQVFVENDLRAFCNPTRQGLIRQAGEDLVRKLGSFCPHCQAPGYWLRQRESGRLCKACQKPTQLPVAEIWSCPQCAHAERRPINAGQWALPGQCDFCNP